MSGVQILTIKEDEADQRLDRWFRREFPHIGQGRIEKMCRKGEIRVDGGRIKSSARLEEGQQVRIPPMPDTADTRPREAKESLISAEDTKMIRNCVIYRDEYIIALNKPPGLAVQGGSGQTRHIDGMAEALMFDSDEKPRLVHRLDRDTSGVMLLARTRLVAKALSDAFRDRKSRKIYWAAVAGSPFPKMGSINFGLIKSAGHGPHGAGEKMICLHPDEVKTTQGAKFATSDYSVLEEAGKRTAWVALVPVTGRTHQLRAHMAEIGYPIIGDGKYATNKQVNDGDGWGAQLGGDVSRKLHLHARSLTMDHPITGARLHLTAPLPEHMQKTWDMFSWETKWAPVDPFQGN
jgi:23S rRNA pseudouridine955/2504/2580 synthase